MYGLPEDVDLSVLNGCCIGMIEVGPGTFNLCLDTMADPGIGKKSKRIRIIVKNGFSYRYEGESGSGSATIPTSVSPLLAFVGNYVVDIVRVGRGDILLRLNGGEISILEDESDFESYEIVTIGGEIVVV